MGTGEAGKKVSSAAPTIAAPGQANGAAISGTEPDEQARRQRLAGSTRHAQVHQPHFSTALLSRQPVPRSKTPRVSCPGTRTRAAYGTHAHGARPRRGEGSAVGPIPPSRETASPPHQ